jgi:hypothetical protein
MSRTISIINGGNVIGQTFLKNLSGFNKIKIGDVVNSRRSVIIYLYFKLLVTF